MRICTKCKRELHSIFFGKRKASKDGISYWCRECKRIAELKHGRRTKESAQRVIQWRKENPKLNRLSRKRRYNQYWTRYAARDYFKRIGFKAEMRNHEGIVPAMMLAINIEQFITKRGKKGGVIVMKDFKVSVKDPVLQHIIGKLENIQRRIINRKMNIHQAVAEITICKHQIQTVALDWTFNRKIGANRALLRRIT